MRCWFVPIELMAAVPQSCLSPACLPPFSVRCTAASWYLGNWTAPKLRPEGHLKPKDGHQKAHKCEDHTLNRLWNGSLFPVSELKQERRKVSSCPTLTGSVFLRQLKFFATQYMLANNCWSTASIDFGVTNKFSRKANSQMWNPQITRIVCVCVCVFVRVHSHLP